MFLFLSIINIDFAFSEIDLVYCIDSALDRNSELKKARAELTAIEELEQQSLANLLPSVGISISRSKVNQERSDGTGLSLDQEYVMESDAISVRQPVYRPKLLRDLQKTKKEIAAERLLLSYKEDTVKMKVAEVYLRLLRAYAEDSLLEKRISLLTEQKSIS